MKILENIDLCYGCGACQNACRLDAITMQESSDGFLYPVIDEARCVSCNACKSVCPALEAKHDNNTAPDVFAAMAEDSIREKSASGGIFTLLAEYAFSKGGYVCGASFGDGCLSTKLVIISNPLELDMLRRSKYIQCSCGDIYTQVKSKLDGGEFVLFTGTPCQCAALKAFLKKPYENLLVVDLICHGTPSPLVWKSFLDEVAPGKEIKDVNFRYKGTIGWSSTLHIEFTDGTAYTELAKTCPFMQAFQQNLVSRKSCGTCQFARIPRQGDITLGDFWGVSKEFDDRKGTSAVIVSTEKGSLVMQELAQSGKFKLLEKTPFFKAFGRNNSNVYRASHSHPGRQAFFDKLNGGTRFSEAFSASKTEKYDAVLFSIWYAANYGSLMTNFALYKTLEDKGYNCIFADIPDHLWRTSVTHRNPLFVTRRFAYKHFKLTQKYKSKADLKKLNAISDTFIVGSDQIWNYSLCKSAETFFFLDFVDEYKNKIAYGTSFGHDRFRGSEDEKKRAGFYLKRFNSVSVREDYAVKLCADEFGVDSREVLDPVFMCDKRHYLGCIESSPLAKNPPARKYVLAYVLDPSEEIQSAIEDVARKLDCDIVCIPNAHVDATMSTNWRLPIKENLDMEDWLYYFKNAEMVVTDSFHGTCFSIIFERRFVALANKRRGAARFYSLLKNFDLEERVVCSPSDISSDLYFAEINYEKVNARIDELRKDSSDWLDRALGKPVSPAVYSAYDLLDRRIDSTVSDISGLKASAEKSDALAKEIEELKSEIHSLALANKKLREDLEELAENRKSPFKRALDGIKKLFKKK